MTYNIVFQNTEGKEQNFTEVFTQRELLLGMFEEVKLKCCLQKQGFPLVHDHPHVICSLESS